VKSLAIRWIGKPVAAPSLGKLLRQRSDLLRRPIRLSLALGRVHFGTRLALRRDLSEGGFRRKQACYQGLMSRSLSAL
jgi:hypothetical protein